MFKTFEKWDTYLSETYGEYMKLPPPDQRMGNAPLSKIDFGNEPPFQARQKA